MRSGRASNQREPRRRTPPSHVVQPTAPATLARLSKQVLEQFPPNPLEDHAAIFHSINTPFSPGSKVNRPRRAPPSGDCNPRTDAGANQAGVRVLRKVADRERRKFVVHLEGSSE